MSIEIEAYKLMSAGRLAEALPLAQRAVAGQRVCMPTHGMLATILLRLGRRDEAESVVMQALELPQGPADAYDALAHVSSLLGQHERSNALYRRAVDVAPNDPGFWHNLASSERSLGRLREAEEACDRTIALDRARYATYLLRSELRVQTEAANHVEELQLELSRQRADDRARMFLGYALAKEFDDLKRYDEAFAHLSEASAIRRRHLSYAVAMDQRKLARIEEVFPSTLIGASPGSTVGAHADDPARRNVSGGASAGDLSSFGASTDALSAGEAPTRGVARGGASEAGAASSRHIFIVGLPRSGTTLLEHMLVGLPGVSSNGETDHFGQALLSAAPRDRVDVFAGAAAADPAIVAARYEQLAGGYAMRAGAERASGGVADRIIEKLPMNYLYLGAIHRALPGAKLILVSRHPVDSCFAMYRTLFGEAYPFSYDFDDLAKYYAAYERLMNHWRASLGDALHEVTYEDLVSDPRRVGERVAEYCGLQWNEQAVEVHKRATVSLTASAAQIRQPIYGSSSGRWRRYEKHLGPLVQALRREHVEIP